MKQKYYVFDAMDRTLDEYETREECEKDLSMRRDDKILSDIKIIKGIELGIKIGLLDKEM